MKYYNTLIRAEAKTMLKVQKRIPNRKDYWQTVFRESR
jgi:hypothetical protein